MNEIKEQKATYQRFIKGIETVWEWLEKLIQLVIILLMTLLVVITLLQVFNRYVLNNPLKWSEEMARYTFVWIVFLSSWYVFKQGGHLGMDFITMRMNDKMKRLVSIFIDLIILFFLIMVIKNAPHLLKLTARQTSAALKLPMLYVYLALPVSAVLMVVEILLGWLNPDRKTPGQANLDSTEDVYVSV